MIWLLFALFTFLALTPLLANVLGEGRVVTGRRGAALALHRAQLAEVARDAAEGRIGESEAGVARLEIERRLLAEAALPDDGGPDDEGPDDGGPGEIGARRGRPVWLLASLGFVPVAALLLYLPNAAPNLPAAPLAARRAEAAEEAARAASLAEQLRAKIATVDPHSDRAREGYILLGNLEDTSGDLAAAADAWGAALAIRFDPTIAAETAEARCRIEGSVSAASAALFRAALAAAPADAPWRPTAEQRLASIAIPK